MASGLSVGSFSWGNLVNFAPNGWDFDVGEIWDPLRKFESVKANFGSVGILLSVVCQFWCQWCIH